MVNSASRVCNLGVQHGETSRESFYTRRFRASCLAPVGLTITEVREWRIQGGRSAVRVQLRLVGAEVLVPRDRHGRRRPDDVINEPQGSSLARSTNPLST